MATRTADRQAQHRRADGADHVVQLVVPDGFEFVLGDLGRKGARAQKPSRH